MTYSKLVKKIKAYLPEANFNELKRIYKFAKEAHLGQKRKTGEPYIEHPLWVAFILADLKLDFNSIKAALLHDVPEDTPKTLKEIQEKFGQEVANLVRGVSRVSKVRYKGGESERDLEALRKLFLAMAKDLRVVIIKLADRLHNMRTIEGIDPLKRERFARETLEIFVPLANRLGIWQIKGELEDLAFKVLYPSEYRWVTSQFTETIEEREKYVNKVKNFLLKELKAKGIKADITGRAKRFYSLYQKLLKHNKDISKIYDLVAVRVIVPTIEDCYKTLGIIHSFWKPLSHRIKDYIAVPKANGYRSLHTTVFCLDGKLTEIQIRTPEMDEEANFGIAAHWAYSNGKTTEDYKKRKAIFAPKKTLKWVKELAKLQKIYLGSKEEFIQDLKIDVFKDRIFVFTPKGDVKDLPQGATPVDFAYAVHTEIGNKCIGAKVNGKMVPLDKELKNHDVVEIITSKNATPSRDWLKFVKTSEAKQKIRAFLRTIDREKNLNYGKSILETEFKKLNKGKIEKLPKEKIENLIKSLGFNSFEDLLVALGEGKLQVSKVIKNLFKEEEILAPKPKISFLAKFRKPKPIKLKPKIKVAGIKGILTRIAPCCKPKKGDKIIGFVTRGKGITVHKIECKNVEHLKKTLPIIKVEWEKKEYYSIPIFVKAHDRIGLFRDITSAVASCGINMSEIESKVIPSKNLVNFKTTLEITSADQLEAALEKISKIKDVIEVRRN